MATDHFRRHGWTPDRRDWNFNFYFADQPPIADYVRRYSATLQHPGLYPAVTPLGLHLTILKVGRVEAFTETEMLQVLSQLAPKLRRFGMPPMALGPCWVRGGNPSLHITPDNKVFELFKLVVQEVKNVVGPRAPDPKSFTAHMTLAYCRNYQDELGLHRQIEAVQPNIPGVGIQLRNLTLVRQRVVNHHYLGEEIASCPVG